MLRCGVLRPEQMEAQDEFLSLEQEFARCQKNFAFYLTLALSFAAAAAGLLFFLLCCLQALFHLNGMGFDIPAQLDGMPQLFEFLCEDANLRGNLADNGRASGALLEALRFHPPLSDGWHEAARGPQYGF